jgi:hypothetical protein
MMVKIFNAIEDLHLLLEVGNTRQVMIAQKYASQDKFAVQSMLGTVKKEDFA